MILKMNFNFNFIRIASPAGPRQRMRSPAPVIRITGRAAPEAVTSGEETVAQLQAVGTASLRRETRPNARIGGSR